MNHLVRHFCAVAVLALMALAAPAHAQNARDDQAEARAEMAAGRNMRIRDIERQVVPTYERRGFQYLTFEYDGSAVVYRLKFIKDGRLLFVDTDPRTGRVLRERD